MDPRRLLARVRDRPLVADRHLGAWLVLLAALPAGLDSYWDTPHIGLFSWTPEGLMGVNYHVYHAAAEAALAGENFYLAHPPGQGAYTYLYPPITVVTWYPFTLLEWTTGYALFTAISVAAGAVGAWLTVAYVEGRGLRLGWVDVALVFALFVLSTHAFGSVYFGNVNVLLGVAFVVGFWALSARRQVLAGAAFAGAALVKVFPAVIGLWLLRDRQWKATAAAILTGVAGLVAGVALFGLDRTVYYFSEIPAERSRAEAFVGGYPVDGFNYMTVQRPLSHLLWAVWPDAPYAGLVALGVLVCAVAVAAFYVDIEGQPERLMAMFATVVVTVLVVPSLRWYVVVVVLPLVALAYVWREGPGRWAFLAGAVLLSVGTGPDIVVEYLAELPAPLAALATALFGAATPQTLGMALALAGCAWYKFRTAARRSDGWTEAAR